MTSAHLSHELSSIAFYLKNIQMQLDQTEPNHAFVNELIKAANQKIQDLSLKSAEETKLQSAS